jgi:hypothetical protein
LSEGVSNPRIGCLVDVAGVRLSPIGNGRGHRLRLAPLTWGFGSSRRRAPEVDPPGKSSGEPQPDGTAMA